MNYEWKTTDIWGLNHLVNGIKVYCFTDWNTISPDMLVFDYTKNKDKCPKCKLYSNPSTHIPNVLHINRKIFI